MNRPVNNAYDNEADRRVEDGLFSQIEILLNQVEEEADRRPLDPEFSTEISPWEEARQIFQMASGEENNKENVVAAANNGADRDVVINIDNLEKDKRESINPDWQATPDWVNELMGNKYEAGRGAKRLQAADNTREGVRSSIITAAVLPEAAKPGKVQVSEDLNLRKNSIEVDLSDVDPGRIDRERLKQQRGHDFMPDFVKNGADTDKHMEGEASVSYSIFADILKRANEPAVAGIPDAPQNRNVSKEAERVWSQVSPRAPMTAARKKLMEMGTGTGTENPYQRNAKPQALNWKEKINLFGRAFKSLFVETPVLKPAAAFNKREGVYMSEKIMLNSLRNNPAIDFNREDHSYEIKESELDELMVSYMDFDANFSLRRIRNRVFVRPKNVSHEEAVERQFVIDVKRSLKDVVKDKLGEWMTGIKKPISQDLSKSYDIHLKRLRQNVSSVMAARRAKSSSRRPDLAPPRKVRRAA